MATYFGGLKRWSGTTWQNVKQWDGTQWEFVKDWNGANWVPATDGAAPVGSSAGYAGESHASQGAASSGITMTLPSGLVAGDLLVLVALTNDSSVNTTVTQSYPGWTVGTALADQGTIQRALYYAAYAPGLAAPTWSLSVSKKCAYQCIVIRNPTVAIPLFGLNNAGGLTQTAPTVGGAKAGSVVLRLYVRKDNTSTTASTPAGHTLINLTIGGPPGSNPCHLAAYYQVQAALGPTSAATTTWDVTSTNSTAWTVST